MIQFSNSKIEKKKCRSTSSSYFCICFYSIWIVAPWSECGNIAALSIIKVTKPCPSLSEHLCLVLNMAGVGLQMKPMNTLDKMSCSSKGMQHVVSFCSFDITTQLRKTCRSTLDANCGSIFF